MSTSTTFENFVWAESEPGLICAFFGHRDTPCTKQVEEKVEDVVRYLIAHDVDEFWLCDQGNFDWLARMVMKKVKEDFGKRIYLCYVSAYNFNKFSKTRQKFIEERYEIIYPNTLAKVPQKFAISFRNKYIAEHADYIICFISHKSGGAYKAVKYAEENNKQIINIADML